MKTFKNAKLLQKSSPAIVPGSFYEDGKERIIFGLPPKEDGFLRVFNEDGFEQDYYDESEKCIKSVIFMPKYKLLFTSDSDGVIKSWEIFPKLKFKRIVKVIVTPKINWCDKTWVFKPFSEDSFLIFAGYMLYSAIFRIRILDSETYDKCDQERVFYYCQNMSEFCDNFTMDGMIKLRTKETIVFPVIRFYKETKKNDILLKSYDFTNKKIVDFEIFHEQNINCLTSFVNSEGEEIIVSAATKLIFWNLKGEKIYERDYYKSICNILYDSRRNLIYFTQFDETGLFTRARKGGGVKIVDYKRDSFLGVYCPKSMKFSRFRRKIRFGNCKLNWMDDEKRIIVSNNDPCRCNPGENAIGILEFEETTDEDEEYRIDFLKGKDLRGIFSKKWDKKTKIFVSIKLVNVKISRVLRTML